MGTLPTVATWAPMGPCRVLLVVPPAPAPVQVLVLVVPQAQGLALALGPVVPQLLPLPLLLLMALTCSAMTLWMVKVPPLPRFETRLRGHWTPWAWTLDKSSCGTTGQTVKGTTRCVNHVLT
jgi:hypothetical protein